MSVLVTGGAGYIGSHMVHALLDRGEHVVVVDDLSTGNQGLVPAHAKFHLADVGDGAAIKDIFESEEVDTVLHFAGSVVVPDSVIHPLAYYRNNTAATLTLISACVSSGIKRFIFSSTAAIYGIPAEVPVVETAATRPINPYGRSKLTSEWILADASFAHNFRYVALRYFNVAGADPKGRAGQSTLRATHLIKRACQVALGFEAQMEIFGTNFATPDGTCVRDYVHIADVVAAHMLALDRLRSGNESLVANVGYGRGFSVLQVIGAVEEAVGHKLKVVPSPSRSGDPPALVSDPSLLIGLGWKPRYDDLHTIVRSALAWESKSNAKQPGKPAEL